jgi:hypothetical protein
VKGLIKRVKNKLPVWGCGSVVVSLLKHVQRPVFHAPQHRGKKLVTSHKSGKGSYLKHTYKNSRKSAFKKKNVIRKMGRDEETFSLMRKYRWQIST